MTTNRLRGACVGAGYFSRFQYEAWDRIPEVEIVAACNRSEPKARAVADEFGIPRTYGIDRFAEMLDTEKPDFVDIITPPETHLALVREAVGRGVATVCQKPLAPTHAEALELAEVVRSADARFMVHENWRWQPWYREAARLLREGAIGQPYHLAFNCRLGDGWGDGAYLDRQPFFRDYPRLFIFETGVHFIDAFRFLLGEPESVFARTAQRNPVIRGEDAALLVLGFPGGVTAVLDASRYNEPPPAVENPRFTFGTMRIDGSAGHLELAADGSITVQPLGGAPRPVPYPLPRHGFAGDCVYRLQRHFVDAVLGGAPFESTIDDYLRSVALVELAYESAATGRAVPAPPVPGTSPNPPTNLS